MTDCGCDKAKAERPHGAPVGSGRDRDRQRLEHDAKVSLALALSQVDELEALAESRIE